MTQAHAIMERLVHSIVEGSIVLSIGYVFFSLVMEQTFALSRSRKPWRATLLDLKYGYLSMLFPPTIYFVVSAVFGAVALRVNANSPQSGISLVRFAIQLILLLFVRDCLIYLRHRIFHLGPVWAFHSIHHSSEEVNWSSALRFHPAENIIEATGEILLFLGARLAGVDAGVLSLAALTLGFYNLLIHSNLNWTYGPLRYVLVSPVFHRWHHSDTPEARDKNFAAMFSFIDLALGTFYMPMNKLPRTLGLSDHERAVHPRTFAGQLLYPFKKRK